MLLIKLEALNSPLDRVEIGAKRKISETIEDWGF